MKKKILKILKEGKKNGYKNEAIANELLNLFNVSNSDKKETPEEYEKRTGLSYSSGIPLSHFDDKLDGTPSDYGW